MGSDLSENKNHNQIAIWFRDISLPEYSINAVYRTNLSVWEEFWQCCRPVTYSSQNSSQCCTPFHHFQCVDELSLHWPRGSHTGPPGERVWETFFVTRVLMFTQSDVSQREQHIPFSESPVCLGRLWWCSWFLCRHRNPHQQGTRSLSNYLSPQSLWSRWKTYKDKNGPFECCV